jgi:predicted nucleotidyltransferase
VITITSEELALVQNILRTGLPKGAAKLWVFGSRAKGTAMPASDLDLAIDMGLPLPFSASAHLASAFEAAPLPYRVDLVDLQTVSPEFRAHIDAHKIPLPGFE